MSKFDELKARAEHAQKEQLEMGMRPVDILELLAIQAQLVEALKENRRAIGDHYAPNDCYSTGPMTGDAIRDLVQCPACSAIALYDSAISAAGAQP